MSKRTYCGRHLEDDGETIVEYQNSPQQQINYPVEWVYKGAALSKVWQSVVHLLQQYDAVGKFKVTDMYHSLEEDDHGACIKFTTEIRPGGGSKSKRRRTSGDEIHTEKTYPTSKNVEADAVPFTRRSPSPQKQAEPSYDWLPTASGGKQRFTTNQAAYIRKAAKQLTYDISAFVKHCEPDKQYNKGEFTKHIKSVIQLIAEERAQKQMAQQKSVEV